MSRALAGLAAAVASLMPALRAASLAGLLGSSLAAWLAASLAGCGAAVTTQGLSSGGAAVDERYLTGATTQGDDKLAGLLGDLNQRVASRPDDGTAWRDLGITQARLGIFKDARGALDRAASSLPQDPYLAGYRGLTLEMLGEAEAAALEYERAARLLPVLGSRLRARAGLVRARAGLTPADPEGGAADGPATIALLAPADLAAAASGGSTPPPGVAAGGPADANVASTAEALAAALRMGLSAASGVTVLGPEESAAFLAADGHAAPDFDDAQSRTAAAKGLARRGVEHALASSFLLLEDGTLHVRAALLPLSTSGAGEPVAPAVEPGPVGQELLPAAAMLPAFWEAAGAQPPPGEASSWMPTSLEGARAFAMGMRAFAAGEYGAAHRALSRAAAACPQVPALARWRDAAASAAPFAADPVVVGAGEPRGLADALLHHAQQEKRKLDEQLGPSDVPF